MSDIQTVIWKEWRMIFRYRTSRVRMFGTMIGPVILIVYSAVSMGQDWFDSFLPIVASVITAVILVGMTVPDSFAGEKERHTLSTLLATRLSDESLLFGKLCVSVAVAWGSAILSLLAGLILVNTLKWDGSVSFYTSQILIASLALSLWLAWLTGVLGVVVSMRSSTVQDAAQLLMILFMTPPLLAGFLVTAFFAGNEQSRESLKRFFDAMGSAPGLAGLALGLLVINVLVTRLVMHRFNRQRLIAT